MTTRYNLIMTTHTTIECLNVTSVVVILKELKAICEEKLELVFFVHTIVGLVKRWFCG